MSVETTSTPSGEVVPFDYGDHPVRTVEIDGKPWFITTDVCRALAIRNVGNVVAALDEDEKSTIRTADSPNGLPVGIVNESGLYSIIMRSRKPEAKAFKRWVTHEVLPAIRRTGQYIAPTVIDAAPAVPAPSGIDVLRAMVEQLATVQQTAELALTSSSAAQDEARVANLRIDAIEGNHDHYAGLGWARLVGFGRTDDYTLGLIGRIAGTVGRQRGIEPGKAPHAHYGWVNTWPRSVWDEAHAKWLAK